MKIVLAYSGGLDTSVAVHWLAHTYSADVLAYCADIGQADDMDELQSRAERAGASDFICEDLRKEYLEEYAMRAFNIGAVYEGKYLLAAPLSRPLIAKRLVMHAERVGADAIAHGATAKGNDGVRFQASARALSSSIEILMPLCDWPMKSRDEELEYAKVHGIDVGYAGEVPYSIDTNLWGTSVECGTLDDLETSVPLDAWQLTGGTLGTDVPGRGTNLRIGFEKGRPVSLNEKRMNLVELVQALNSAGAREKVGRVQILENRITGFKTRGLYEAPAATILYAARSELDAMVLDRETLHFKRYAGDKYGELVYTGYWYADLREGLDALASTLAENVTGDVELHIHNGNIEVLGRFNVDASRYSQTLADYGNGDTFDHDAGRGFGYVWGLATARHGQRGRHA